MNKGFIFTLDALFGLVAVMLIFATFALVSVNTESNARDLSLQFQEQAFDHAIIAYYTGDTASELGLEENPSVIDKEFFSCFRLYLPTDSLSSRNYCKVFPEVTP
jgi:hypothetical protein